MEIINLILSITAIVSMALAVAVGLKNELKSTFISAILYVLAIDSILCLMSKSLAFDFYEFKYSLLIPNILLGAFAFTYTKMECFGNIKFKIHHIFGAIVIILLLLFLFIIRADNNSPIYHVLKSSINFCFIFMALSDINKELSSNRLVDIDTISNLKKNQRFMIAMFLIVITDIVSICFAEYIRGNFYLYLTPMYLLLVGFIGYNELFYKLSKCDCLNLLSEHDNLNYENKTDEDEVECIDMQDDGVMRNSVILSEERIREVIELMDRYIIINREFYLDPDVNAKQMAVNIGVKYSEFSRALNIHFGLTFKSYVNAFRIERAKELLKNNKENNYTIDTIGELVGFKNKNSFYRAFKKHADSHPLRYIKSDT